MRSSGPLPACVVVATLAPHIAYLADDPGHEDHDDGEAGEFTKRIRSPAAGSPERRRLGRVRVTPRRAARGAAVDDGSQPRAVRHGDRVAVAVTSWAWRCRLRLHTARGLATLDEVAIHGTLPLGRVVYRPAQTGKSTRPRLLRPARVGPALRQARPSKNARSSDRNTSARRDTERARGPSKARGTQGTAAPWSWGAGGRSVTPCRECSRPSSWLCAHNLTRLGRGSSSLTGRQATALVIRLVWLAATGRLWG